MEQRISLVTLGVRDLGRALAFYKALGWSGAQQPDDEIGYLWEVAHNPDWKLADAGDLGGLRPRSCHLALAGVEVCHRVPCRRRAETAGLAVDRRYQSPITLQRLGNRQRLVADVDDGGVQLLWIAVERHQPHEGSYLWLRRAIHHHQLCPLDVDDLGPRHILGRLHACLDAHLFARRQRLG